MNQFLSQIMSSKFCADKSILFEQLSASEKFLHIVYYWRLIWYDLMRHVHIFAPINWWNLQQVKQSNKIIMKAEAFSGYYPEIP